MAGPTIVCGDLNSRNTAWGFPDMNTNGHSIACWADGVGLNLLYDTKDHPTFFSGRHKKWSNPYLFFVPTNIAYKCERIVLDKFPKSGHCPIVIDNSAKVKIKTLNKKRWNFTDTLSQNLPSATGSTSEVYSAFTSMLSSAAKASIPRGRRGQYIPCWYENCEAALKE